MQSFAHLRTLKISNMLPILGQTISTSLSANDVCKALLHQRRSLQMLDLRHMFDDDHGGMWQGRIESLVQFDSLACLALDGYLLMGHGLVLPLAAEFDAKSVLPKHLKALHVEDTLPTTLAFSLESLVEHVAWFDNLECIIFESDRVKTFFGYIFDIVEHRQRVDRAKEQLLGHGIKRVNVVDFEEQESEEDTRN